MRTTNLPSLLVSYPHLKNWLEDRFRYAHGFRDWALDSGAYSAGPGETLVSVEDYTDIVKLLRDGPLPPTEVFALDVMGDWRASLQNTRAMWSKGVRAVPTFHHGEPWDLLRGLCKSFPKVALGGCARMPIRKKLDFAEQCFARVWPHRLHGFGFGSEALLQLPFHSVDCSTWETGPAKYGRWDSLGGVYLRLRGSAQPLRLQVEHSLRLERQARQLWAGEMARLGEPGGAFPVLRLAEARSARQAQKFGRRLVPAERFE